MSDEKNPFDGMDLNQVFGQVVEQAKNLQGKMEEVQEQAAAQTVEGQAGGGLVKVTATGKGRLKSIKIDPVAVDSRDVEMLEDLIVAASNDALRRASELMAGEMGQMTGGINLGGIGDLMKQFK